MLQCFFHKPGEQQGTSNVIQENNLQTKRNTVKEKKKFEKKKKYSVSD